MSLFKKKSSGFDEQDSQPKPKSRGSLAILLILLGGFAYLYFFTSLIVPHEVIPEKTAVGSPEVKQSMPLKPATQAGNSVTSELKKTEEVKPAAPLAPVAAKPVAPPAPVPAPAKPAALPAQTATKPAVPAPPKNQAAAPVKKDEPKPVKAVEPKPIQPGKKLADAKSAKAPAKAVEKLAVKKKPDSYTIFAGEFPAGEEASAAEAKLARLGIKPIIRQESTKNKSMNRLFAGVYSDYDGYSAALDKLRQSAKGAFGVEKDGKYFLYAGSFSSIERGQKEQKDLLAKGFALKIQPVVLPLSSVRITAGQFTSKSDADKVALKMKAEGLAVKVVPKGR